MAKKERQEMPVSPGDKEEEKEKTIANAIAMALSDLVKGTPSVSRLYGAVKNGGEPEEKGKKQTKGIRVTVKDNTIQARIHVTVDFGKPIPEIARAIQKSAKDMLDKDYPEYKLLAVNISVNSVRFDQASFLYREESIASLGLNAPSPQAPA